MASPNLSTHANHVRQLFERLRAAGLAINREKCVFGCDTVTFLGHTVSGRGIVPLASKVAAIAAIPRPVTKVDLQRFLGCINFYHRFVPKLAAVLAPLHRLVTSVAKQKDVLVWDDSQVAAFSASKDSLANATMLVHPDPSRPLSLTTDASDVAVGAVLSQGPDHQPLAFYSKKLSTAEVKYSAFDRELLALYLAVRHFRSSLEGRSFVIYTDHKPLCGAISSAVEKSPRQTRHLSFIAEFCTDIRHVSGESNVVADTLSRPAVPASFASTGDSPDSPVSSAFVDAADHPTPALVDEHVICALSIPLCPGLDLQALAAEQHEDLLSSLPSSSSLRLERLPLASASDPGTTILCDVSLDRPRPVVPPSWTQRVFDCIHGISHAGAKATLREISRRFVWRGLRADVIRLARLCQDCQVSKVHRHVRAPLVQRPVPLERFSSLHVDLVGPLPESEGFSYLFTVIDRTTRWLEAIPLRDITAASCASALIRHWICRFGVPSDITSDQGRQFTSALWTELHCLLGISCLRTTAYHPQANGMVERVHRVLKERLMARSKTPAWMDHLPLVLLGIRTSVRQDLEWCPAELVYGATLRLPGEFLYPADSDSMLSPSTAFVARLRSALAAMRPAPSVHHRSVSAATATTASGVPQSLSQVSHVFLRVDAVRRPLSRPYEGPFRVLKKGPKTFVLCRGGKAWTVSVDRLKPAWGSFGPSAVS